MYLKHLSNPHRYYTSQNQALLPRQFLECYLILAYLPLQPLNYFTLLLGAIWKFLEFKRSNDISFLLFVIVYQQEICKFVIILYFSLLKGYVFQFDMEVLSLPELKFPIRKICWVIESAKFVVLTIEPFEHRKRPFSSVITELIFIATV